MKNKIINIDLEFDNIQFDESEIRRVTKNAKIALANTTRKGIKLNFSEQGKAAHIENTKRTSQIRKYNHTIYEGTCKKTGKKIVLDIHGLRKHKFNPANVSRVVNGYKKSHKGYIWKILKQEKK